MIDLFLRIFQHLLPDSRAWRITIEKTLTKFFKGLTGIGSDIKLYIDLVWLDIFPSSTRELSAWETQWGLPDTVLTEQERRDRLDATWKAIGGQSPSYIQNTLQANGFDVYIHEWWQLPILPVEKITTSCGAIEATCGNPEATCGATDSNLDPFFPPIPRDPRLYLADGGDSIFTSTCGNPEITCDAAEATCGATLNPPGFPLINKYFVNSNGSLNCGNPVATCGSGQATCGSTITEWDLRKYDIPDNSAKWPYFLYIGGENFPDVASVPASRKNEFETLCLKICPTQQWLGMLIQYV